MKVIIVFQDDLLVYRCMKTKEESWFMLGFRTRIRMPKMMDFDLDKGLRCI